MKIPKEQKAQIVEGMLAMLDPEALETYEEAVSVSGSYLINNYNITTTKDGKQVLPGGKYILNKSATRPCNHKQKICQIIADADTAEEWQTRLAEYLTKYAKNPAEVIRSIPVHLSLQNKKQHDN